MTALMARYPDFYRGSGEFVDMQQALEPEVLALWQARDGLMDQLQLDTATWGLKYWEETLGIAMIQNVAESFSNGAVAVTEFPSRYRIEIKFVGSIGTPPNMDDLTEALREILPAHLAWDYVLVFNTWAMTRAHTWGELKGRTWGQVKGEKWQ